MTMLAPGNKRKQVARGVVYKMREEVVREDTMRVIAPALAGDRKSFPFGEVFR